MNDAPDDLVGATSQSLDFEQLENELRHEAVRERAYEIWEKAGRPDGRDQEHWLLAEQQVCREAPNT